MENPFYSSKKDKIYHPKYIPNSWTRGYRDKPAPNPNNPLYNGSQRNGTNNPTRMWYLVFAGLAGLMVMNYLKMVRQQQFQLEENQETVVLKKHKYPEWQSDTVTRDLTLVPYEVLEKPVWTSPQVQGDSSPRNYQIAYRPSRPPMPYDLATVQQSAREYVAMSAIPKEMSIVTSKSVRLAQNDATVLGGDMVFAGSFDSRENAEWVLKRLKNIGYDRAEIVMKEKLPHLIVVTGFNYREKAATSIVKSLRKNGIKAYATEANWREIYRNKKVLKSAR